MCLGASDLLSVCRRFGGDFWNSFYILTGTKLSISEATNDIMKTLITSLIYFFFKLQTFSSGSTDPPETVTHHNLLILKLPLSLTIVRHIGLIRGSYYIYKFNFVHHVCSFKSQISSPDPKNAHGSFLTPKDFWPSIYF